MEYIKIDGHHFCNMMINACNKLQEEKDFVNSLNVFPVPDGDTGTNMSMTFKSAVDEIKNFDSSSIAEVSKKLSKGALMGARGNSGVILSQILRGIAKGFEGLEEASVADVAKSILEGSKSAYKAVMRPTEGTILTIVKAAGERAMEYQASDVTELLSSVCEHAENVLNKTPEMLPVLKKAKVVDAGGMGLLIILKGMYEALKYNIEGELSENTSENKKNTAALNFDTNDIKYGYCTEFFVIAKGADVDAFKRELEPHGDSMIVVGVDDIIKVHIHTNDPGLILSKAVKLGELSKVKIDNMKEQHRHLLVKEDDAEKSTEPLVTAEETEKEEKKQYAFIAVAMGDGIRDIFKDLGVDHIIEGGQTMNPSTQDILNCIEKINADNIFILPNNKNIIMAATQAAELTDKNVIVIPTKTIPQGITCITAFNPESTKDENVSFMNEAIKNVTTCSITYAVRDTEMDGYNIKSGDILGLKEGKISKVGKDKYNTCEEVIEDAVSKDTELITIFYGEDCEEESVNKLVEILEGKYPDVDIQCYNGKQPLYYFIVSVE